VVHDSRGEANKKNDPKQGPTKGLKTKKLKGEKTNSHSAESLTEKKGSYRTNPARWEYNFVQRGKKTISMGKGVEGSNKMEGDPQFNPPTTKPINPKKPSLVEENRENPLG